MRVRTVDEILQWIDQEITFASESLKLCQELGTTDKFIGAWNHATLKVMIELKDFIQKPENDC